MDIKVTVITVCLNEKQTIARTVKSVLTQNYTNLEYIVIDGGSDDGTIDILESYRHQFDRLVIERDDGIYFAMNKAVKHATGDVIYFLNADDYFYNSHVIRNAAHEFDRRSDLDILSGRVEFFNVPSSKTIKRNKDRFRYRDKLQLYKRPNPQQCLFVRKELFRLIGRYDTRYKLCADYDWLVRALNQNVTIAFVDDVFCYFDYQGISYTRNSRRKCEKRRIILRNSTVIEIYMFGVTGLIEKLQQLRRSGR